MTLDAVKAELQAQYRIENFITLRDYDLLPTGRLYTQLRRCHKVVFDDDERIVFVAENLKRTYKDQPCDIITALQQYIQHHDIPHFFIMVLTNIEDMPEQLDYVHKKYNPQEVVPMAHIRYD